MSSSRAPSWSLLALLVVAQFMVVLDITIVNVALPAIGDALDASPADLSWVVTAYVLCSGGLLLVGGRAGDQLGRRRVFLAGLTIFTLASLACGIAPSLATLLAARAVQGAGAALLTPTALAILTTTYEGQQRARALSIWGAVASAGVAVGVVLGGLLTTWLTWRWIFLVNAPVGLATLVLARRRIPDLAPVARRSLNLPGTLAAVAGLATLVYGFSTAPDHGWGSATTLGVLGLAVTLLAVCAFVEARAKDPLVPAALWRLRSLTGGSAVMLGATGILAGAFFLNSVYLQQELGWSALRTGVAFLPLVVAIAGGVHATSHLIGQVGSRPLLASGLTLITFAAAWLASTGTPDSYLTELLPGLLVLGAGVGLVFPSVQIAAMHDVGHQTAGAASGLMSTAHEVGAALGVGALAAIAAGRSGFAYDHAFWAVGATSLLLTLGVAARLPSVRPEPGAHVSVH